MGPVLKPLVNVGMSIKWSVRVDHPQFHGCFLPLSGLSGLSGLMIIWLVVSIPLKNISQWE